MTTEATKYDELPQLLNRSISGETAIITGGASGMGRATAHLFASEGAKVVIADLGADRVQKVVDEINTRFGAELALGAECDVADLDQLRNVVESATPWSGRLDIVVNNAGMGRPNALTQPEDEFTEAWDRVLAVNLSAQAQLVRLALPYLLKSDAARVVNIASTEAIVAQSGLVSYAASKTGVAGLTRGLAVELGRQGVTVNCICPGPIDTPMTKGHPDEAKEIYARRRVPLRRYGIPEEVAQMTLNLCLPSSSYVNGAVIPVDGGMTIRHT
ncbi:MAG: SDR family NAD(P)-dependent oxidoreductase [Cumulibacter sp.]